MNEGSRKTPNYQRLNNDAVRFFFNFAHRVGHAIRRAIEDIEVGRGRNAEMTKSDGYNIMNASSNPPFHSSLAYSTKQSSAAAEISSRLPDVLHSTASLMSALQSNPNGAMALKEANFLVLGNNKKYIESLLPLIPLLPGSTGRRNMDMPPTQTPAQYQRMSTIRAAHTADLLSLGSGTQLSHPAIQGRAMYSLFQQESPNILF